MFGDQGASRTPRQAAAEVGLEPPVVTLVTQALGMRRGEPISDGDVRLLRYVAAAIDAGFPIEAILQLIRIYGHAIGQIADAEVRLVHMYVHEPLMRAGSDADEMAQELTDLVGDVLPLSALMIDELHRRLLAQFIDQDVIGHMEAELTPEHDDGGRVRVAVTVAFVDLAGYTQLIEEQGELTAIDAVERFLALVTSTLPDEARVIKTIGDEVMIVGADAAALSRWAVEVERRQRRRRGQPLPRIGIHHGHALYRDGDYYGRAVNLASRVAACSGAGRGVGDAAGRRGRPRRVDLREDRRGPAPRLRRADRNLPRHCTTMTEPAEPEATDPDELIAAVRSDALIRPGRAVVVMLSGGRDSSCLLDVAVAIAGTTAVTALHVNYGLRDAAAADENYCAALCERLGVELTVRHPGAPTLGNLQAWARDARYGAAAQLATVRGGADVAAGHTATDQVETILYRLASSPSRRALLGMRAREGALIRPLLRFTRSDTAAYCRAHGLQWREDETNDSTIYARGRVRGSLVPALREIHPGAERNVLALAEILRDEAAVLDEIVDDILGGEPQISMAALRGLPAGARAAGRPAVGRRRGGTAGAGNCAAARRHPRVARQPARRRSTCRNGVRAVVTKGVLSFTRSPSAGRRRSVGEVTGSIRWRPPRHSSDHPPKPN